MFKKHNPSEKYLIPRFNEFDEARVYIEDMKKDKELVISAIDYMITHKEYYFLLKNMYRHIKNNELEREIFEYALMSLDICPKRKDELNIYLEILKLKNGYSKDIVEFLKGFCSDIKNFIVMLLTDEDPYIRKSAVSILKHCPDEKITEKIKSLILKENDEKVKKEMLKYLKFLNESYNNSTEKNL